MPTRWTPDTRENVRIHFDDNEDMFAVEENGVATTLQRGAEVLAENQSKNHAMAILRGEGIIPDIVKEDGSITWDERPFWEMKNDKVNIKVNGKDKKRIETLVADLAVTVNG